MTNQLKGTAYYRDLHEYIHALESAGKLVRIKEPINKDTEMHPLVRLQFRGLEEEDRKAFLFENVYDSKGVAYDIPVVLCAMAGSRHIYGLGLQCEPEEIPDRWKRARTSPIAPVVVEEAPVHHTIIQGEELDNKGLSLLPVPISTPGFDNAPYTTSSHWISKDPETGVHNVGNYRGQIKSNTRIGCFCGSPHQGLRQHVNKWKSLGQKTMPAAIVIGVPPSVSYTSVSRLPHDVSEYDYAGGLAGAPLELTKCKTLDLLVPAHAEIVIEGLVSLEHLEMEGPFGEFPGYMAKKDYSYFMDVTCITMKQHPVYQAFLSQLPPSESSKIRQMGWENVIRQRLREHGIPNVLDVHQVEASGSWGITLIKIDKQRDDDGQNILKILSDGPYVGKMVVVVDKDIDIREPSSVYWALAFRMQPHRDVQVAQTSRMALDPSIADPSDERSNVTMNRVEQTSALLIDATMDWPYPPVALPKKQYMDRALELWNQFGLQPLRLKEPWYGYSLGYWTEEDMEEADLAVEGRYFETAEKQKREKRISFE